MQEQAQALAQLVSTFQLAKSNPHLEHQVVKRLS
jgi:hypothetical protein